MDNILEIKDLNVSYKDKHVLKDISFNTPKNKITAIIGPSGCGKSTLLQSINRLLSDVPGSSISGDILYKGRSINSYTIEELRKEVGMVLQKPTPFPFSIAENISYGLRYHRLSDKKEIAQKTITYLEAVELYDEVKDDLKKSALKLSGGQQQRLCIARALAIQPNILLLDEPCSSLDLHNTSKIEELLLRLKNDHTVIIVTHNLFQAKRLADQVVFLLNGELIESGSAEDIFNNPKESLTKEYLTGAFG